MSTSTSTVENVQEACAWFAQRGGTDESYLAAHFRRFAISYKFAQETLAPNSVILDVGAHWLHQALLFAQAGHQVICADTRGSPLEFSHVKAQAEELGIKDLLTLTRLELGEGLESVPDNSVDAIVLSEIIEHLAFNPIPMWKVLYGKLKEGGRIYISTPNSCHYKSLHERLVALTTQGRYSIAIDQVIVDGTYGHHWKEYSIDELRWYFGKLSSDFNISRIKTFSLSDFPNIEEEIADEKANFDYLANQDVPFVNFRGMVSDMEVRGREPFGRQIFMDIVVERKAAGITIDPPWIPS